MTHLMPILARTTALAVADLVETTHHLLENSKAEATRREYRSAWAEFEGFSTCLGVQALDATPETVALYVSSLVAAGKRPATISKKLSGVSQAFVAQGKESPVRSAGVRAVLQGVRRTLGVAQSQRQPLTTADVRRLVEQIPDSLRGKRERCHLLMAFAMGARRSEVAALDLKDVQVTENGLLVSIRRSKTDQEGEGAMVGVCFGSDPRTCPVRAYLAWKSAAGLGDDGPVFRHVDAAGKLMERRIQARELSRLIKRYATKAGIDPSMMSSHSCRSGFVTEALNRGGASLTSVMRQTRHRSISTVRKYDRPDLFESNASAKLGL